VTSPFAEAIDLESITEIIASVFNAATTTAGSTADIVHDETGTPISVRPVTTGSAQGNIIRIEATPVGHGFSQSIDDALLEYMSATSSTASWDIPPGVRTLDLSKLTEYDSRHITSASSTKTAAGETVRTTDATRKYIEIESHEYRTVVTTEPKYINILSDEDW
jgi:hypothetical protein